MITRQNSDLIPMGTSNTVKRYVEYGEVVAEGEGVIYAIEDYIVKKGYDLKDTDVQVWRASPGLPNHEVSTLGFVRNADTKKILPHTLKDTYEDGAKGVWRTKVGVRREGKVHTFKPHRLVAEAFIDKEPKGHVVSHKNDIPIDNRLINLEYVPVAVNVAIKYILKDLRELSLMVRAVDYIYTIMQDVVEDVSGVPITNVAGLTPEEIEEVRQYTCVSGALINAIYDYKTKGTGLLNRLAIDGYGRYYLPEPAELEGVGV